MSHFSNTATPNPTPSSNDDVVFEGGDWKLIDRRDVDYNKVPRAPADHENGTEEHARTWAREFYLSNKAFLRGSIKTRRGLAYFFKTWYSSSAADDTRANIPPRPFNQILFALCNDGKVLHLRNYDQKRGRLRDPVVVWHKESGPSTSTDFDKAVAAAVEKALTTATGKSEHISSVHISQPEGQPPQADVYYNVGDGDSDRGPANAEPSSPTSYSPTTPPRPTRPASTNAPPRPPTLGRQMTSVGNELFGESEDE